MSTRKDVLVWLDLEMTGLDPDTCAIVQLGMILTDQQLKEIVAPFAATIWQPESVLEKMDPTVRAMHTTSGLLDKIRSSSISVADAEKQALEIIAGRAEYKTAVLCGNSIWQDRRFLAKHMPSFENYLHYRQLDVSSLKLLGDFWYQKKYKKPEQGKHTALFDVEQSILELKFLRQEMLK